MSIMNQSELHASVWLIFFLKKNESEECEAEESKHAK